MYMDNNTINEDPFHEGGKYGPGQEVYYSLHRIRLWKWYCKDANVPFKINDASLIYKKKKEILQSVCQSLNLPTDGTNKLLIARLDRHDFTQDQLQMLSL
jgi:hypothetical protein